MTDTYTGGAAFPLHADIRPPTDKAWCGMTLRDYFAAKAMQAEVSATNWSGDIDYTVCRAYEIADAMLEVRQA